MNFQEVSFFLFIFGFAYISIVMTIKSYLGHFLRIRARKSKAKNPNFEKRQSHSLEEIEKRGQKLVKTLQWPEKKLDFLSFSLKSCLSSQH